MIAEACHAGARLASACAVVGIAARTLQRWRDEAGLREDARAAAAQERIPANRLSDAEREAMLSLVNQPAFAHWPPSQSVPALADQGRYLASASSFYRVLRENDQLKARGKRRAPGHQRPPPFVATAPHQVWSWDITYLATNVKGVCCFLYLIMDVFSRKIVGWEIDASESAEQAASVLHKAYLREGVAAKDRVLHADNGAPMKGATLLATRQRLGVVPSFSRPSVSDDNRHWNWIARAGKIGIECGLVSAFNQGLKHLRLYRECSPHSLLSDCLCGPNTRISHHNPDGPMVAASSISNDYTLFIQDLRFFNNLKLQRK
jgi:putative transposase